MLPINELALTILSLDTLRSIVGIDPYHFWGMTFQGHEDLQTCDKCFAHYRWLSSDKVGRHDVINACVEAEQAVADILGYYPGYKYSSYEEVRLIKPRQVVRYTPTPYTLQTDWRKISQVGALTYTSIQAAKAVVYVADVDDVSISQTVDAGTVPCEIVVCYPGTTIEIRPVDVSVSGVTATILLKRWLMNDPDNWESGECVDASDSANLLQTVDIYRKWYDPSSQIMMAWEPDVRRCGCFLNSGSTDGCVVCQGATQSACAIRNDFDLGFIAWQLADWNATTEEYDRSASCHSRFPDLGYVNYLHGAPPDPGQCYMSKLWSRLVTILTVCNMDTRMCSCSNIQGFTEYWREEISKSQESHSYVLSQSATESPIGGHRRGHVHVWDAIRRKIE